MFEKYEAPIVCYLKLWALEIRFERSLAKGGIMFFITILCQLPLMRRGMTGERKL
jgi:hypothetical protein